MLNITNHQGNADQIPIRYHFIPVRVAIIKRQERSVGEDVVKREPLCTVGGNVNRYSHYRKRNDVPQKIKTKTIA